MPETIVPVTAPPAPTTQVPEPKKKKQTVLWVVLLIVIIGMLGGVGYWLWSENKPEDEPADQQEEEEDESGEPKTLVYTNPIYPDLRITYDDTWTVSDREEEGDRPGTITTYVKFAKDEYILEYTFVAESAFGGVFLCSLPGDPDYVYLEGSWARIRSEEGYYYDGAAHIKGTPSWNESVEEECPQADYVTVDMGDIITSTNIEIPEGAFGPGTGGGYYMGLVSIYVYFEGAGVDSIIKQVDDIVLNTVFD